MLTSSIALCTYNGAAFVGEQLRSIARQSRLPKQLVVCDDNSSDATIEIVRDFALASPFKVEVFRQEKNQGVVKNFSAAVACCTEDIVFFADQDDVWHENKISESMKIFEGRPNCGYVFSNANLISGDGKSLGKTLWDTTGFTEDALHAFNKGDQFRLLMSSGVYGTTMSFRRYWADEIFPIETSSIAITHDRWACLYLSACGATGYALDGCFVDYRQHSTQTSGNMPVNMKSVVHKSLSGIRAPQFTEKAKTLSCILQRALAKHPNSIDQRFAEQMRERIYHLLKRDAVRNAGCWDRLRIATQEIASGRYGRHSSSLKSAVIDVFCP